MEQQIENPKKSKGMLRAFIVWGVVLSLFFVGVNVIGHFREVGENQLIQTGETVQGKPIDRVSVRASRYQYNWYILYEYNVEGETYTVRGERTVDKIKPDKRNSLKIPVTVYYDKNNPNKAIAPD
jgi:hypothetical protein